jgi:hypothetical protein
MYVQFRRFTGARANYCHYTAVFIDEAYNFQPAPRGSTANASNRVLDLLMKSCEMEIYRSTTTFILAGYKDELLPVLGYNQGFASRFPITFEFPDYTVPQLQKILVSMIKERGLTVASKATCGVNIPLVLARVSCVATDILIEIAHLCVITSTFNRSGSVAALTRKVLVMLVKCGTNLKRVLNCRSEHFSLYFELTAPNLFMHV